MIKVLEQRDPRSDWDTNEHKNLFLVVYGIFDPQNLDDADIDLVSSDLDDISEELQLNKHHSLVYPDSCTLLSTPDVGENFISGIAGFVDFPKRGIVVMPLVMSNDRLQSDEA